MRAHEILRLLCVVTAIAARHPTRPSDPDPGQPWSYPMTPSTTRQPEEEQVSAAELNLKSSSLPGSSQDREELTVSGEQWNTMTPESGNRFTSEFGNRGSTDYNNRGNTDYGNRGNTDYNRGNTDYNNRGNTDYGNRGSTDYGNRGYTEYGNRGYPEYTTKITPKSGNKLPPDYGNEPDNTPSWKSTTSNKKTTTVDYDDAETLTVTTRTSKITTKSFTTRKGDPQKTASWNRLGILATDD